jgi:Tol biopolymer transport system component
MPRLVALVLLGFVSAACCPKRPLTPEETKGGTKTTADEKHLTELRQLTFGGENAEAYWSFGGKELVFQATTQGAGCDRIYRIDPLADKPTTTQVSSGAGATTCAYFLPGDKDIIYASTHLGGKGCPPKPDRSQGYVWAIYDSYDIFRVTREGAKNQAPQRLTETKGYDAEATVCSKDGSIVFTSVRDGDLELYRMDADGKNVKRLTSTPGYDGGAFFDASCSQIVWRASRPVGDEMVDYQRLLKQGLVRPTKLELWVAKADGSEARQVTYLNAASFAPFFFPSGKRIIFSSNYGDPRGREFDLWAINVDGTELERVTHTPGFDGFPMFSPDGTLLAFASNRNNAPGSRDTNLFLARWADGKPAPVVESAADRVKSDMAWLAHPERGGRGIGTPGLEAAGGYIERRFRDAGLSAPIKGSMRHAFEVPTRVNVKDGTKLELDKKAVAKDDFQPLAYSGQGKASGRLVFAGFGIDAKDDGIDDYEGVDAKDKIVVVRRFAPDKGKKGELDDQKKRRFSDIRYKAWVAREKGATALVVVDAPPKGVGEPPAEAAFPSLRSDGQENAGIPVVMVKRSVGAPLIERLERGGRAKGEVEVVLDITRAPAFNVVGKLEPNSPEGERLDGAIVIGAHYDHLGLGGPGSLAPDSHAPHLGADDNASGVAALIEAARDLKDKTRRRAIWFVAFSGEESGVLGSSHFVRQPPPGLDMKNVVAMLNMDMVGRLRDNKLLALGGASASEWPAIVEGACKKARVSCTSSGDGYGPSDHTPFFSAGIPVLHFFTGAHGDYHKPSDSIDRINAGGTGQVAKVVSEMAFDLASRKERLSYQRSNAPAPVGDVRSSGASLGTVPDYAGPPGGQKGVLLADVRKDGPAERAGMKRGDILVQLGPHAITDVRDMMFALGALKPEQKVTAIILREGKRVEVPVTMGSSRRR